MINQRNPLLAGILLVLCAATPFAAQAGNATTGWFGTWKTEDGRRADIVDFDGQMIFTGDGASFHWNDNTWLWSQCTDAAVARDGSRILLKFVCDNKWKGKTAMCVLTSRTSFECTGEFGVRTYTRVR